MSDVSAQPARHSPAADDSPISVVINGEPSQVPDGSTVADLIARRGLIPQRVAVEINRCLVPRKNLPNTQLAPGDQIEIVTFVGGG